MSIKVRRVHTYTDLLTAVDEAAILAALPDLLDPYKHAVTRARMRQLVIVQFALGNKPISRYNLFKVEMVRAGYEELPRNADERFNSVFGNMRSPYKLNAVDYYGQHHLTTIQFQKMLT